MIKESHTFGIAIPCHREATHVVVPFLFVRLRRQDTVVGNCKEGPRNGTPFEKVALAPIWSSRR